MIAFKCCECGAAIPVDRHGALAGMQVSGPCPACGCPLPFTCPTCGKSRQVALICDHGKWRGLCCMKTGCYIATACYGDYNHPDVLVFRRFRDEWLMRSVIGRLLVSVYYVLSPPVAHRLGYIDWLSSAVRKRLLEPSARMINRLMR